MNWVGYRAFSNLLIICMAIALGFLGACSNSVLDAEIDEHRDLIEISQEESSSSLKSSSSQAKSSSSKKTTTSKSSSSTSKEKSSSSIKNSSSSSKNNSSSSVKSSSSKAKSSSSVKSSSSSSEDSSSSLIESSSVESSSSEMVTLDVLELDDKEYPYADIPRVVIETENRVAIKDRETEIPAKLQIWGEKQPETEILDLTIRGRGNTSWWDMPKKGYKIEFVKKQSMLGMPKDKDWALIANYADRTLMRNYIAYRLSAALGAYYAPRCEFAELYLNGEYLGVYLMTETIKISENRVNIPKNENSYIVEFDKKYKTDEQVVFSDVLLNNGTGKPLRVHDPKNATEKTLETLQKHVESFEEYLKTIEAGEDNEVEGWMNVDEAVKHYWVQEFSKNVDASFSTSVYFSWIKGEKIMMGPVWDFDLGFGNIAYEGYRKPEEWHIRNKYWNIYLFDDKIFAEQVKKKWSDEHHLFESVLDSIDKTSARLKKAVKNNFKRWDILGLKKSWLLESYESYDEVVNDWKNWITKRIQWIDSHY